MVGQEKILQKIIGHLKCQATIMEMKNMVIMIFRMHRAMMMEKSIFSWRWKGNSFRMQQEKRIKRKKKSINFKMQRMETNQLKEEKNKNHE